MYAILVSCDSHVTFYMYVILVSCDCHVTSGAHNHTDVWDHKMMSVVHQTCNKLTQGTSTSVNSLSVNLKATVSCLSLSLSLFRAHAHIL